MSGSPCQALRRARSKVRQWWTAALCAASFATGQMVWGEEPRVETVATSDVGQPSEPRMILNDYLRAPAATSGRWTQESGLRHATSGRLNSEHMPAAIQDAAATAVQSIPSQTATASSPVALAILTNPFATSTPAKPAAADAKPAVPMSLAAQARRPITSRQPVVQRKASENLAPIVPSWALPRPRMTKSQ